MDDAWVGSIDIAIKKAKTAVFFGMPTGEIGKLSQPGKSLYGIEHSNEGLITFPGGLPIVDEEGVLVGAIGVSGSSVENDHEVAAAGLQGRRRQRPAGASLAHLDAWRRTKEKAGLGPAFFVLPSCCATSSRCGRPCCRRGARDRWRSRRSRSTPAGPACEASGSRLALLGVVAGVALLADLHGDDVRRDLVVGRLRLPATCSLSLRLRRSRALPTTRH